MPPNALGADPQRQARPKEDSRKTSDTHRVTMTEHTLQYSARMYITGSNVHVNIKITYIQEYNSVFMHKLYTFRLLGFKNVRAKRIQANFSLAWYPLLPACRKNCAGVRTFSPPGQYCSGRK